MLMTTVASRFRPARASLLTAHTVPTACWRRFRELFLPPERCVGCCGHHRPRLTSLSIENGVCSRTDVTRTENGGPAHVINLDFGAISDCRKHCFLSRCTLLGLLHRSQ